MRNLKRTLSLVLASAMLVGMMVTGASAVSGDFNDSDEITNTEAVDVMTAIGVFEGTDKGDFNPTGILTREQAAKIVAVMLLGEEDANKLTTNSTTFKDVAADRWSAGYIGYCVQQGILAGTGNGNFDPEGKLTGLAFAKMLLVALGYDAKVAEYVGNDWAINVAADAVNAGIAPKGIVLADNMTREQASQMAFQTLTADMVRYSNKGTTVIGSDGMQVIVGASAPEKVVNNQSDDYRVVTDDQDKVQQFCEKYFSDLTMDSKGNDDLGRPANVWKNDGDEVGTYAKSADDTTVVNPDDSATMRTVLTSSDYFNLKSSDIGSVDYYLNGDSANSTDALLAGDVVEIFRTNGKVTTVAVARYTLAKIDDVDTDVSSADAKNDVDAYVSLVDLGDASVGDGTYNNTDINGYAAGSYVEDTYLAIALNGDDEIVASYVAETVEGPVTAYKANKTVTVDGTKYTISGNKDANSVSSFDFDESNYVAYLTAEDYVMGIEGAEAVKLDDVYYVYGTYYTKAANGSSTFYAQVVDLNGAKSEIEIEATTYVNTFGKDAAADTFQKVDGLYTFTDKDAKDSSGKNANGDTVANGSTNVTTVADPKANNDKLSAVKYDTAAAGDFYVNSGNSLSANVNSSSGSISLSGGSPAKAYITKDTKFILVDVDGTTADMSVETYTGSARIASGKDAFLIATKSGSSYEASVVIVADDNISNGVTNTDSVLYLTGASSTEVKDGYEATVYFMDGSSKTVTIDQAGAEGFYTYSIDKNGVYELDVIASGVTVSGSNYDDETGFIPDTTIDSIYNNDLISFTGAGALSNKLNDIALSADLQVVDARTGSNRDNSAYTNKIDSLSKLQAAMKRGTVTATAYVDDGEVLLISVISMPDTRSSDKTVKSATVTKVKGDDITDVKVEPGDIDNSAKTIKVTVTGTANEGDQITVSAVANDAAASVSAAVTLTYTSSSWGNGSITVTAEDTTTQVYTVSVK